MATSSCQRISTKPTTIRALSEERVDISLPRSEKQVMSYHLFHQFHDAVQAKIISYYKNEDRNSHPYVEGGNKPLSPHMINFP